MTTNPIAEAIRTKIGEAGKSHREIARAAGIPLTTFNRKLNLGGESYTVTEMKRLADALETEVVELLGSAD